MIDGAERFQLCWSRAASRSEYVEREWRHALRRDVPNFIRPFYWQIPMPPPPPELSHLHFAFYKLPGLWGWLTRTFGGWRARFT